MFARNSSTMSAGRLQFNTRIPKSMIDKVKDDCDRNRREVTRDVINAAALDLLFSLTLTERRALYEKYIAKASN